MHTHNCLVRTVSPQWQQNFVFLTVSPFLNFQFYVLVSDTKPSLVLICTWAAGYSSFWGAISGVWFYGLANLVTSRQMDVGSIKLCFYRDLFSLRWETTANVFISLSICLLVLFSYKNTSWAHWNEQLFATQRSGFLHFCIHIWHTAKVLGWKLKVLCASEMEKSPYFVVSMKYFPTFRRYSKLRVSLLKNLFLGRV